MKQSLGFMTDYPEKGKVYTSLSYASIGFVILPLFLAFSSLGYALRESENIWVELIYHSINFLAALFIFFGYLRESFWNVKLNWKPFLKKTAVGIGVMLALAAILIYNGLMFGNIYLFVGGVPVTEIQLMWFACDVVFVSPTWGTVCMGLLAPFAVSCLFYATAFAPVCSYRPILAYGALILMLAIPRILFALTFWQWHEQLILFFVQLPFHLIACRLYQKTDTVWAPILALTVVNLLCCGCILPL